MPSRGGGQALSFRSQKPKPLRLPLAHKARLVGLGVQNSAFVRWLPNTASGRCVSPVRPFAYSPRYVAGRHKFEWDSTRNLSAILGQRMKCRGNVEALIDWHTPCKFSHKPRGILSCLLTI